MTDKEIEVFCKQIHGFFNKNNTLVYDAPGFENAVDTYQNDNNIVTCFDYTNKQVLIHYENEKHLIMLTITKDLILQRHVTEYRTKYLSSVPVTFEVDVTEYKKGYDLTEALLNKIQKKCKGDLLY